MRKFMLLLLMAACNQPVQAEFNFDTYQPATFAEIKTNHNDALLKASQRSAYAVSATTHKYRLPVIFSKELRKLSHNNETVIKAWQTSLRVPADFVDRYQHEFKAEFGDETYWIPVQEDLLPQMGAELQTGDHFELYVVVIGAIKNKLVFLTTEFKSDRAPQ